MNFEIQRITGLKSPLISILLVVVACSGTIRSGSFGTPSMVLSEGILWDIHQDVRYTSFRYADGSIREGILLRWQADSIQVQPGGSSLPVRIPARGIVSIKIRTGNRIWESMAAGGVLASGYFLAVKGYDLGKGSFWSDLNKVLVSPLMIMASIAIGATMERYEEYTVPDDFQFDYDKARSLYKFIE